MINKIFSFYSNNGNHSANDGDQLIIEAGMTHFACLVRSGADNKISSLEWFKHTSDESKDYEIFLKDIEAESKLLDKYYRQTNLYINNQNSVLVPPSKFEKQFIDDYLNAVLGETTKSTSLFDEISERASLVNVFRVQTEVLNILSKHLLIDKVEHTYSQVLRQLYKHDLPSTFLNVQFYDSCIIATVFNNGKLQFMQSFTYLSTEDVLYFLISLSQRLQLKIDQLVMKVSGMVDTQSALYRQLVKYFRNVSTETTDEGRVNFNAGEYPTHYFTPIYNLAL